MLRLRFACHPANNAQVGLALLYAILVVFHVPIFQPFQSWEAAWFQIAVTQL